jgi:hypothetical protein
MNENSNCVTGKIEFRDNVDIEWSVLQRLAELQEEQKQYVDGFIAGFLVALIAFSLFRMLIGKFA